MSEVVILPLLVALATAIVTLGIRFAPRLQRAVSVGGALAYAVAVGLLATRVLPDAVFSSETVADAGTILTYQLSGWQAPYGITLVADSLSVFMLAIAAIVAVAAAVFSTKYVDEIGQSVSYHPLFHFMLVGISGSFLTGDIFNLFVWFEVMLMPSYILVVFNGGEKHTDAALKYTALNLMGSAVMLLAIGGLYSTTGTLNMADLSMRLSNAGAEGAAISDPTPVLGLAALLLAVFALKAGIVPFQFWVPSAYKAAPAPATAMLAGVTKKVGVYAIIRLYFVVFAAGTLPQDLAIPGLSGTSFLAFFGPVLFVLATASVLVGGVGAVSRPDLDGLFAYSSIGQVGFIVLPLGIAATVTDPAIVALGVVAALVYSLNHALAKTLLFLLSGSIEQSIGSVRFDDLGGLTRAQPLAAASFFVGGLALVGIPPLTGFFGKLLVFDTAGRAMAAGASSAWLGLAVALVGAILTIAYVSRAWSLGFWGDPSELIANMRLSPQLLGVVVALAVVIVALGVGFDPVLESARAGAQAATDPAAYREAVLEVEA